MISVLGNGFVLVQTTVEKPVFIFICFSSSSLAASKWKMLEKLNLHEDDYSTYRNLFSTRRSEAIDFSNQPFLIITHQTAKILDKFCKIWKLFWVVVFHFIVDMCQNIHYKI